MKFLALFTFVMSLPVMASINLVDGDFMICNGHDSHFTYEFYLVNKAKKQANVKVVVGIDQEYIYPNAQYREGVDGAGKIIGEFTYGHSQKNKGEIFQLHFAKFDTTTPAYHYEGQGFFSRVYEDPDAANQYWNEVLLCTFNW